VITKEELLAKDLKQIVIKPATLRLKNKTARDKNYTDKRDKNSQPQAKSWRTLNKHTRFLALCSNTAYNQISHDYHINKCFDHRISAISDSTSDSST
jgi:hypothetical protein